jgi:uncharacterized protein (TIRG00374 family)
VTQWQRGSGYARMLRIGLALLIVGWLVYEAGPRAIIDQLASTRLELMGASLLTMLIYSLLKAWNWKQLLRGIGLAPGRGYARVLYCYLSGAFFGTLIPSTASTDAIRALLAKRSFGGHLASHAASVVGLNAINLIAACILGLAGSAVIVMQPALRGFVLFAALLLASVIAVVAAGYALLKYRRAWLMKTLRSVPRRWFWARKAVRKFADSLLVFERAQVRFMPILASALIAMLFQAVTFALIAAAVDVELGFRVWLMIMPLSAIVGLIPLSISGFGVGQAAFVFLLAPFGVAATQAFVISALAALVALFINTAFGAAALVLGPGADPSISLAGDKLS